LRLLGKRIACPSSIHHHHLWADRGDLVLCRAACTPCWILLPVKIAPRVTAVIRDLIMSFPMKKAGNESDWTRHRHGCALVLKPSLLYLSRSITPFWKRYTTFSFSWCFSFFLSFLLFTIFDSSHSLYIININFFLFATFLLNLLDYIVYMPSLLFLYCFLLWFLMTKDWVWRYLCFYLPLFCTFSSSLFLLLSLKAVDHKYFAAFSLFFPFSVDS